jgi:hypothetical protein
MIFQPQNSQQKGAKSMKKMGWTIVFISMALAISSPGYSQEWAMIYSGSEGDYGHAIQETFDQGAPDGYVVAGSTWSFGAGYGDFLVMKFDSYGNAIWQKTYGGSVHDWAYAIEQTPHGGYIVGGITSSFGAGSDDIWVVRLDSVGNILCQNTYCGTDYDTLASLHMTSDGGYVMAGRTNSYGTPGVGDLWALKLNTDGTVAWQKTFGGNYQDFDDAHIRQTTDGGYILVGTSDYSASNYDFWVMKLDGDGSILWQKAYGGNWDDRASLVIEDFDQGTPSGYVVAGHTYSFGSGKWDIWIVKLDSAGSIVWQKAYGGSIEDYIYDIQQTVDGGYVAIATTYSLGVGKGDLLIFKIDSNGNIVWQKSYGGPEIDGGASVRQNTDGGYVVTGRTAYFDGDSSDHSDLWVLKLDTNGEIPGCDLPEPSGFYTIDTWATVSDTAIDPQDSSVQPSVTQITGQTAFLEPLDTCAPPLADFVADITSGNAPLTVQFMDQSIGSRTTYSWNFGDGSISSEQNPSHEYTTTGDFAVTLTVSGPGGSDTEAKTDYIRVSESQVPAVVIRDAYTCDGSGQPQRVFDPKEPIQYRILYDVQGDPGTQYKAVAIIRAFGKTYRTGAWHYPGTDYLLIKDKVVPGTAAGKTKTINYKVKLKLPGQLLDIEKTTSQITVTGP